MLTYGFSRDGKLHLSHTMRLTHVFQNANITYGKKQAFNVWCSIHAFNDVL